MPSHDRRDPLIPAALYRLPAERPGWQGWLDALPALVEAVCTEWSLTVDGPAVSGECAMVLPVRTADEQLAAAKFGWPHPEAELEFLALRTWAGDGAVRLLRADPARSVLLLERAGPTDLTTVPIPEACQVVADLYRRLHRPAHPRLTCLSTHAARWAEELAALPADAPVPHRLASKAASLARDFAADPETDGIIVHADLHYANVLAGERQPWLAIDPKPLSGDPCFEVAPLLWNRWEEASVDARSLVRERVRTVVEAARLDGDRVRDWVIVRELVNAKWCLAETPRLSTADREWITLSITIAKAVQC